MKGVWKNRLRVPMLALALALVMGVGASNALGEDFGLHQINFKGAFYDAGINATQFNYEVIAHDNYPFDYWVLALNPECFGPGHVVEVSETWEYVNPDVPTGVVGIKFTQPYAAGEGRWVWFRIKGNVLVDTVEVVLREGCTNWRDGIRGPECGGLPQPPGEYNGKTIGYWKHQLAVYLGYKEKARLHEENLGDYLAQIGYTAEQAYEILRYHGNNMADLLNKQLMAAKLNVAAGYLFDADIAQLISIADDMVADPSGFTRDEMEEVKDKLDELNNTGE